MVFAKRTIVALLAMSWLTPTVQAVGDVTTPATLPVVTVPKAAPLTQAPVEKLMISGPTLGDVDKPVPLPGQQKAAQVTSVPKNKLESSSLPSVLTAPSGAKPGSAPAVLGSTSVKVGVASQVARPPKTKRPPSHEVSDKPTFSGAVVEKRGYYDSVQLIAISDRDYNRIVFPEPIVKGRMPAGTKLSEELVYLSGNRAMMFQLAQGQTKVIQLVVELASGRVETLYLKPQAVPGTVHRVDGALDAMPVKKKGRPLEPAATEASPHTAAVAVLKSFVRGEVPASFEAAEPPAVTRFDKFSVVPAGAWTDGSDYKVYAFQLIAAKGQSAIVAPSQFYRDGVRSVMVDGDEVSEGSSPFVYVVEDLSHDD